MADKLSNRLAKADELANGLTSDLANDNEIIRGLERMSEEDPDGFSSDILNYINRQKAEIERLQKKNGFADECIAEVEDALYRGSNNDWASKAIDEYNERIKEMSESEMIKND